MGDKTLGSAYLLAKREVPTIDSAADATKVADDIQSHLSDARALLDADPDFTEDEKDSIADAVYTLINTTYQARLRLIGVQPNPVQPPGAGAGQPAAAVAGNNPAVAQPALAGPRVNLQIANPNLQVLHLQNLQEIQRNNRVITPTAGRVDTQ